MNAQPHIESVLQELRGKRAELNILITGLERYIGITSPDAVAPAPAPERPVSRNPAAKAPTPKPTAPAKPRPIRQSKPPGQTFADRVREVIKSGQGMPSEFENRHVAEALKARGIECTSNNLAAAICTLTSQGLLELVRKDGMTVVRRLNPKWAMQAQIRAEIDAKHAQSD